MIEVPLTFDVSLLFAAMEWEEVETSRDQQFKARAMNLFTSLV